jgi:hypothetical protein
VLWGLQEGTLKFVVENVIKVGLSYPKIVRNEFHLKTGLIGKDNRNFRKGWLGSSHFLKLFAMVLISRKK